MLDLCTELVDFSNAFAQADILLDNPVYIEMPKDYLPTNVDPEGDYVLKLNKSLYGQAEAPRL